MIHDLILCNGFVAPLLDAEFCHKSVVLKTKGDL